MLEMALNGCTGSLHALHAVEVTSLGHEQSRVSQSRLSSSCYLNFFVGSAKQI